MSKKLKYLLIIPIIFLFLFLFGIFLKKYQPSTICTLSRGEYLPEYNECQVGFYSIDNRPRLSLFCALTGSQYDSCASPCRHSSKQGKIIICVQNCEQVCKF